MNRITTGWFLSFLSLCIKLRTLLSPYDVFVVPTNDGGFSLMYMIAGVRIITLKIKQTRFTKHNDTNGSLYAILNLIRHHVC